VSVQRRDLIRHLEANGFRLLDRCLGTFGAHPWLPKVRGQFPYLENSVAMTEFSR